ncbi:MAG: hypothetical protein PHW04_18490 [Candidatus Wallbacteria bacterium]|nr:hypothetical protein [Candidatus Wallbacteria bacterium]
MLKFMKTIIWSSPICVSIVIAVIFLQETAVYAGTSECETIVIAYGANRQISNDICKINPDGSGKVNLTNTPDEDEEEPVISPDGSRIAFTSSSYSSDGRKTSLCIMNSDGSDRKTLTSETDATGFTDYEGADFSADGTSLAFSSHGKECGVSMVWTIKTDGTGIVKAFDTVFSMGQLCYSGNDKIIYAKSLSAEPAPELRVGIFIRRITGSESTLTDSTAAGESVETMLTGGTDLSTIYSSPCLSPDGKIVAFVMRSNKDFKCSIGLIGINGGSCEVLELPKPIADAIDSSQSSANKSMISDLIARSTLWDLCLSPDGQKLAFNRDGKLCVLELANPSNSKMILDKIGIGFDWWTIKN